MTERQPPVFVQRSTYRRRRLADGARLLPVLGTVMILIPLLWRQEGDTETLRDGARTAWVMTYLFLVWLALAVISGIMSRFLGGDPDDETRTDGDGAR